MKRFHRACRGEGGRRGTRLGEQTTALNQTITSTGNVAFKRSLYTLTSNGNALSRSWQASLENGKG